MIRWADDLFAPTAIIAAGVLGGTGHGDGQLAAVALAAGYLIRDIIDRLNRKHRRHRDQEETQ